MEFHSAGIPGQESVIQNLNNTLLRSAPYRVDTAELNTCHDNEVAWTISSIKIIKNDGHERDAFEVDNDQIPLTVQNCRDESYPNITACQDGGKSDSEDDTVVTGLNHENDPESERDANLDMTNRCYMCFKRFIQMKNLYAHIRKIHSVQPKIKGGIVCPLCKMQLLRQEHLRNHLETLHEVKVANEEHNFNSMEAFVEWKTCIEKESLSMFVRESSAKVLAVNQTTSYYKCHRSGYYNDEKAEKRRKKLKSQGSSKIGATCPASMQVVESMKGITVKFWSTHVGHKLEAKHLLINKEDRNAIRDMLVDGMPWNEVLERIQSERSKDEMSRLDIISRQDLRNIQNNEVINRVKSTEVEMQEEAAQSDELYRPTSQAQLIEKTEQVLAFLKKTEIAPEFQPQVSLMIDNLLSTIQRRAVKKILAGKRKKRPRIIRKPAATNQQSH